MHAVSPFLWWFGTLPSCNVLFIEIYPRFSPKCAEHLGKRVYYESVNQKFESGWEFLYNFYLSKKFSNIFMAKYCKIRKSKTVKVL